MLPSSCWRIKFGGTRVKAPSVTTGFISISLLLFFRRLLSEISVLPSDWSPEHKWMWIPGCKIEKKKIVKNHFPIHDEKKIGPLLKTSVIRKLLFFTHYIRIIKISRKTLSNISQMQCNSVMSNRILFAAQNPCTNLPKKKTPSLHYKHSYSL